MAWVAYVAPNVKRRLQFCKRRFCICHRYEGIHWIFTRFGGDLLSHTLRCSTIGATVLNGRVRDGTGCFTCAMTTKPSKNPSPSLYTMVCMLLIVSRFAFYWIKSSLSDH